MGTLDQVNQIIEALNETVDNKYLVMISPAALGSDDYQVFFKNVQQGDDHFGRMHLWRNVDCPLEEVEEEPPWVTDYYNKEDYSEEEITSAVEFIQTG